MVIIIRDFTLVRRSWGGFTCRDNGKENGNDYNGVINL